MTSYRVEVLNLGKRPAPGIDTQTSEFTDPDEARRRHCQAIGELVLLPGMTLLGAQRHDDAGGDGILASARLRADDGGGRVEVILRRT